MDAAARTWSLRLVTAACLLALLGIGVSVAHFLWPTPLLFALFMTAGQGSLGLAMLLYLAVIFIDLRRSKVL
jgi:hypothetical protein